jgi:hypothetical protein
MGACVRTEFWRNLCGWKGGHSSVEVKVKDRLGDVTSVRGVWQIGVQASQAGHRNKATGLGS